ncbi:MAG: DUF393 domain-containing protein [Candidatus Marinimicrobia bacterium]|jgi:predicted DCC family thiol-disulfide oxidoreductase YuxK|nr:DUF393 domain-containing protein [Candidatus Neomarinimicrobiota bacterium]MBT3502581.1 DUF393 domain-containing protein [Candidatus Neomarinimicrobiota bacterium]MBT3839235.1 DUF393 domain-containing protein [Candidatus Neomarinimicrobiota bacterium]MBT3999196.1 DUF393 domain-containing protein [Candidatus Neomarinimicrobiota bacterium]MBT4281896.1 DUF393 domain-containing protein [Candidatus Neomarinimicrobiota bacterium]
MEKPVIYYDGDCSLCNHAIIIISKIDKKNVFRLLPFSHLLNKTNSKYPDSIILKLNDIYYSEGEAVLKIVNELEGVWWVLGFGLNLIPLFILDRLYRIVSTHRNKWINTR